MDKNTNSSNINTWAYKTKLMDNINSFARDYFPDIKRKKEITLAFNVCKQINNEQKIGAKIVKRSLENKRNTNSLKFDDQVLRGFAVTWYKQTVVHYVDFDKIGMFLCYSFVL